MHHNGTAAAVARIIRERFADDAPESLTRVFEALKALNGRKLTKRHHAALIAAAGEPLTFGAGVTGTGYTIETVGAFNGVGGWRLRLSWDDGCPIVDTEAIWRDNPAVFIGAADRNAIRSGYLAEPSRIQAIADAVDAYRAAAAALEIVLAYPMPDRYEIRRTLAECHPTEFAATVAAAQSETLTA